MFGEPLQVLDGCRQVELVLGARQPAQPESCQAHVVLDVSEQGLDPFASGPGLGIGVGFHQGAGNIAGMFVGRAGHFAGRFLRTALGLEGTDIAIALAGPVSEGPVGMEAARRLERLAVGADVDVPFLVIIEVFP